MLYIISNQYGNELRTTSSKMKNRKGIDRDTFQPKRHKMLPNRMFQGKRQSTHKNIRHRYINPVVKSQYMRYIIYYNNIRSIFCMNMFAYSVNVSR